ncbi:hypothetical protein V6U81_16070 [Micromonospora sp. CPCC 205711]|uniref:hypothetical protein n=1 Tax=Micromonospora sp. CPCC 205547 TaxID=3122400 RepID=UPI002FF3949F
MSRELDRFYRSLADDTDPRGLIPPDQVRRHADRQARTRVAVGALAAAVLVAGTAVGSHFVLTAGATTPVGPPADTPAPPSVSPAQPATAPSPAAPTGSPRPTGSTSRTAPGTSMSAPGASSSARTPTSIPDRAFFDLAVANSTGMTPAFRSGPVLPALCGAEPGGSGVVQRRARTLAFKLADTPKGYVPDGSYRHSITIYGPGRAVDALAALRKAVRDCPEQEVSGAPGVTSRQRLLDSAGYGDESVLFELRRPFLDVNGQPNGEDEVRLVRAVRIGDVVTVLWEQGWEGTSSPRSQVDADSRRAVDAVRNWWE